MNKKIGKKELFPAFLIFFGILTILTCSENALSIGISSVELPKYVIAEPHFTASYEFTANGYGSDTAPYVNGDLSKYVTLSEPELIAPYQKRFIATLSIPAEFNESPGMHSIMIGAEEIIPPSSGGITVRTRVQSPLNVFILYPYKYLDARIETQNVNENETVTIKVYVVNLGKPFINMIKINVEIYNASNVKIKELRQSALSLDSGKDTFFDFELNTTGMRGGEYYANATVDYDGLLKYVEKENFMIGQMRVKVIEYTKKLYSGMINKFEIKAFNEWNGVIEDAYAEINVYTPGKNLTSKTATDRINPLSNTEFMGYIDANNTIPGEYPVKINLFYEKDKTVERGTVSIVKLSERYLPGSLWMIAGLAIGMILVILTLINVILLLKRGNKEKPQQVQQQQPPQQPQNPK
jgi:hypothetical protein